VEHSNPVSSEARSAPRIASVRTAPYASSHDTPWGGAESTTAFPTLVAQMEELLGSQSEPDSQFFVESWTLGVEAAAHRFHERRDAAAYRDFDPSSFRPFDFSTPINFVQDAAADKHSAPSMPSGFSAAWKAAYGVPQSSPSGSQFGSQSADAQAGARAGAQPLTMDEACRMLGVSANSTRKQIKAAYRQLVWRYHPDRLVQGSEQDRRIATDRMISINEAYHMLCDSSLAAAS
jgi:hypothetical protein